MTEESSGNQKNSIQSVTGNGDEVPETSLNSQIFECADCESLIQQSDNQSKLKYQIKGRANIEGLIICQKYNVQLHLMGKCEADSQFKMVHHVICQKTKDEQHIYIYKHGNSHFAPFLVEIGDQKSTSVKTNTSQHEKKVKTGNKDLKNQSNSEMASVSQDNKQKSVNDQRIKKGTEGAEQGYLYEINVLMLLFSRGHLLNSEYEVGYQVKVGAKFDDAVLKYKKGDKWYYRFIQCKHRLQTDLPIKYKHLINDIETCNNYNDEPLREYFHLQKYFAAFEKLLEAFKTKTYKDGVLQDVTIFTNIGLDIHDLLTNGIQVTELENEDILNVCQTQGTRYKLTGETHKLIGEKSSSQMTVQFFDKLVFAVNQPSADEIGKFIIDQNLQSSFNICNYEVVVLRVKQEILLWLHKFRSKEGWIKGENSVSVLNEANAIVLKVAINEPFQNKVNNCEIQFEKINDDMKNILKSPDRLWHLITEGQTFFSALKLFKMLEIDENYKNSFVFTSLNSFKNHKILENLSSGISLLVVECQFPLEDEKNTFGQQIESMLNSNSKLKLILIAAKNHSLLKYLKRDKSITEVDDKFICADLREESRKQLLSSEINFQGENVKLCDLIKANQLKGIDEETLSKLALKEKVFIGEKPIDLSEVESFYIKLWQQIDCNNLKGALINIENESISFMFSGVNDVEQLLKACHSKGKHLLKTKIETAIRNNLIIIISELNGEDLFTKFTQMRLNVNDKDIDQRIVTWLHFDKRNWYLKQIYQPKFYMDREFLIKSGGNKKLISDKDFLNSVNDRVVLLSDEPGMGKTIFFIQMVSYIKHLNPKAFVFNIPLRTSSEIISQLMINYQINNIVKCLLSVTNEQSKLTSLILKNMLLSKQHFVYLIFDGFDEISTDCQQKVIKLMKYLKAKTKAKMWLSTRPVYLIELEKELKLSAINFKPLDESCRNTFLKQFYKMYFKLCFKPSDIKKKMEKCDVYVSSLLESSKYTIARDLNFLGVPLQLRLLAEGFKDDCLTFLNSDEKYPTIETIGFLDIYRKFITAKYQIYFTEKNNIDNDFIKKLLINNFNEMHFFTSLRLIFSNDTEAEKYLDKKENNDNEIKSIGIVQSIGENGELYFIHRTFAEYFVAQFIFVNCINNKDSDKHSLAKQLYKKVIQEKEEMILKFINYLSIEGLDLPLHLAIN
ncbi:hypothetical protein CHUAL_002782 [Chamberlinius hualienensis]